MEIVPLTMVLKQIVIIKIILNLKLCNNIDKVYTPLNYSLIHTEKFYFIRSQTYLDTNIIANN